MCPLDEEVLGQEEAAKLCPEMPESPPTLAELSAKMDATIGRIDSLIAQIRRIHGLDDQ